MGNRKKKVKRKRKSKAKKKNPWIDFCELFVRFGEVVEVTRQLDGRIFRSGLEKFESFEALS